MSILTIATLVLAVICVSTGVFLKWREKQQQPKEGEVQAQFIVVGGCLALAFIILGIIFFGTSIASALFGH